MASTFYMVEMDYPDHEGPGRVAYDSFYDRHIAMLLDIPGFLVAQRFECLHAATAPFLAIYQLAGPEVMNSEAYTSRAGRLSVPEAYRRRMSNWDRNLVQADLDDLKLAVSVNRADCTVLNLIDRAVDHASPLPAGFSSMIPVGLDRTFVERGVQIGEAFRKPLEQGWKARVFRPIHDPRQPRHPAA